MATATGDSQSTRTQQRSDPVRAGSTGISKAGVVAAAGLAVAIYVGSLGLATFDSALIGYAVAIVALTYAVVDRYSRWLTMPSTGRYWRRGWQLFLSWDNFRRLPATLPRALVGQLVGQGFIRRRGWVRWIGHQCLFWGVILATLITFPLVFGWLVFHLEPGTDRYRMFVFGQPTITFDYSSFIGWSMFRGLAYASVLVIIGCSIFLWRRLRDRSVMAAQRMGFDMVPLLMLLIISITGLMLTASATFLAGAYYSFLVLVHMASVVAALVFIPFGKFFHVLQRPASVGIQLYTEVGQQRGSRPCARCGLPLASEMFLTDLQATLDQLGQRYQRTERPSVPSTGTSGALDNRGDLEGVATHRHVVELCPRCKRVERGLHYFEANGRGVMTSGEAR